MLEEKNLQSFVMYASFYDAAMGLNDEDFREYILALKDYALYGIEYTSQNIMVNGLLMMAYPNLEAAWERRKKQVKNGDFGVLGGRPRKGETAEEYKARKAHLREQMGLQTETLNKPEGFLSETLNVDADVDLNVDEKVKEDVDLNVKGEGDLDVNVDCGVYADRDETIDINKNTNDIEQNNSFIANPSSSSYKHKPEREETRQGEEPRKTASSPQHQSPLDNTNINESETKHGKEPRQERGIDSKCASSFASSITLDDEEECEDAPAPDQFRNCLGYIQDLIRYDAEPDYEGMKEDDIRDAFNETIERAIGCERREGRTQRYRDLLQRALKIYMHLYRCSEEEAQEDITRLYRARAKMLPNEN